ncbi:MAG: hypothetical protein HY868_04120 [Chloroflexi bacterium]|nr:hypothetical protein [Chloroflexota bacterium]
MTIHHGISAMPGMGRARPELGAGRAERTGVGLDDGSGSDIGHLSVTAMIAALQCSAVRNCGHVVVPAQGYVWSNAPG